MQYYMTLRKRFSLLKTYAQLYVYGETRTCSESTRFKSLYKTLCPYLFHTAWGPVPIHHDTVHRNGLWLAHVAWLSLAVTRRVTGHRLDLAQLC